MNSSRDLQKDLAVLSNLDDPVRRRLYEYVASHDRPVGRDEAAGAARIGERRPAEFVLVVASRLHDSVPDRGVQWHHWQSDRTEHEEKATNAAPIACSRRRVAPSARTAPHPPRA